MEKFRSQIEASFNNNEDLIPEEVWEAAILIGKRLKKKFGCEIYAKVIELAVEIQIKSGIFTKKDFNELTDEIKLPKINIDFDPDEQTMSVSSGVLQ